jgi:thiaminase/transcriptional activator TenA
MLHDGLWHSNLDLVQSCLGHPFVQALGEGTLKSDQFRAFIGQDAFFLRAFLKAYALALARSEDAETAAALYDLIGGVLEELKLHRAYAAELGIDLQRVAANPAYTDFLLRTAWHTSLGETLATMTPCIRLYVYLGGELISKSSGRHPYRRWIEA